MRIPCLIIVLMMCTIACNVVIAEPILNCTTKAKGSEWLEINCTAQETVTSWEFFIYENRTETFKHLFDNRTDGERIFLGLQESDQYTVYINASNESGYWGFGTVSDRTNDSGAHNEMILSLALFLLLLNLGIFLTPVLVKKFTGHQVSDYIVRQFFWMAGVLLLWFNCTIFRQLAVSYNLGIDNLLLALWWMLTLISFALIFVITYVMAKGAIKLSRELRYSQRMGEE